MPRTLGYVHASTVDLAVDLLTLLRLSGGRFHDPAGQATTLLAERLDVGPQTLLNLGKRLENAGLVTRDNGGEARRLYSYALTASGQGARDREAIRRALMQGRAQTPSQPPSPTPTPSPTPSPTPTPGGPQTPPQPVPPPPPSTIADADVNALAAALLDQVVGRALGDRDEQTKAAALRRRIAELESEKATLQRQVAEARDLEARTRDMLAKVNGTLADTRRRHDQMAEQVRVRNGGSVAERLSADTRAGLERLMRTAPGNAA